MNEGPLDEESDDDDLPNPENITVVAAAFEGGLGVVAVGVGWLVGLAPLASIELSPDAAAANFAAIGWGFLATVPMLVGLLLLDRFPPGPFREMKHLVEDVIVPMFAKATMFQFACISLLAGVGEELLFRGLLQAGLGRWLGGAAGVWAGLVVAAVLFGACHWLTDAYAILATLIGVYLGWLFLATGNLLAPITAHGVYDFVALVYLVRWKSRPGNG